MRQLSVCFYLSNKRWAAFHSEWQPRAAWSAAGFTPSSQTLICVCPSPPWHVLGLTQCAEINLHLLSGLNLVNVSHEALQYEGSAAWAGQPKLESWQHTALIDSNIMSFDPSNWGSSTISSTSLTVTDVKRCFMSRHTHSWSARFLHWVEAGCSKSPALLHPPHGQYWEVSSWWPGTASSVKMTSYHGFLWITKTLFCNYLQSAFDLKLKNNQGIMKLVITLLSGGIRICGTQIFNCL